MMPMRGDRLFHLRIAEASDNSALLRVVTELFDERNNPLFEQLGRHFETAVSWQRPSPSTAPWWRRSQRMRPSRAREAMHVHLQNSHDRFTAIGRCRRPVRRGALRVALRAVHALRCCMPPGTELASMDDVPMSRLQPTTGADEPANDIQPRRRRQ